MTKNPRAPQLPRELSRKHISRAQRDARNTRLLVLSVGGALLVAFLLIIFGLLRDSVFLPNEPVAIVGDQQILTREFQQRVRLDRLQLIRQYDFYSGLGLSDTAGQFVQQLSDAVGIGSQTLNTLIDEALYRQAAPELGVIVTAEEVQRAIEEAFDYYREPRTPTPTRTPLPTSTPPPDATATPEATPAPTVTPQPTATPVTAEGFQSLYQAQLSDFSNIGMSEADFRRLFETQLIVERVQDIVMRDVVTITDQVEFQYIRADTLPDVEAVQQAVVGDGFEVVYGQVVSQTFTLTNVVASEIPFAPRSDLEDSTLFGLAFADAAFSTPISDTFGVISNTAGTAFYIGRVLNREVRELSPDALSRRQSAEIQDWLAARREQVGVQVLIWADRVPTDPVLQ